MTEELHDKDKIHILEEEVNKLKKEFNIKWDKFLNNDVPEEEEKEKISNLKNEYYKKSDQLNESRSNFENNYGYTPTPRDVSTESENSETDYDSSEPADDKIASPHNFDSNHDPDEGPSTRNDKPKGDPDEERPQKKTKFSHDFSSDSKNYFLPIFYRLFSFKSIFSFIRILLLIIPISFPDFYLFIYYFCFIDLYFINFIVSKIEGAIFLHKTWKKIKLFWKIGKSIIKLTKNHYIYTLTILVLFFIIFIFL